MPLLFYQVRDLHAWTLWVSKNGNDTIAANSISQQGGTETGDLERPFLTIQAAVDAAANIFTQTGELVIVSVNAGLYDEAVTLADGVFILEQPGVLRTEGAGGYCYTATNNVLTGVFGDGNYLNITGGVLDADSSRLTFECSVVNAGNVYGTGALFNGANGSEIDIISNFGVSGGKVIAGSDAEFSYSGGPVTTLDGPGLDIATFDISDDVTLDIDSDGDIRNDIANAPDYAAILRTTGSGNNVNIKADNLVAIDSPAIGGIGGVPLFFDYPALPAGGTNTVHAHINEEILSPESYAIHKRGDSTGNTDRVIVSQGDIRNAAGSVFANIMILDPGLVQLRFKAGVTIKDSGAMGVTIDSNNPANNDVQYHPGIVLSHAVGVNVNEVLGASIINPIVD